MTKPSANTDSVPMLPGLARQHRHSFATETPPGVLDPNNSLLPAEACEPMPELEAMRVVLIDDAPDFRYLMRLVLEREGNFKVVSEAGNGLGGLAAVRKYEPQLVLLDVSMPTVGGFEVLPKIRALCPEATVVMLSNFSAETPRSQGKTLGDHALALGADGYIQKGQRLSVLLSCLRAVIGKPMDGEA